MCVCPTNETSISGNCSCISGFTRSLTTGKCCPPNEEFVNGACNCNPTFYRDNTSTCVCPQYQHIENGTCVCNSGFNTVNGACECPLNEEVNNLIFLILYSYCKFFFLGSCWFLSLQKWFL